MTTFVDVTATWQQPSDDGAAAPEPASGFVTVTAIDGTGGDPIAVLDPSGDVIYRKAGLRLGLDANGSVTVRLPASDDAGLNPSGFVYRFEAVIAGSTEIHEVEVLSSAAPSVNLADIAPAQSVESSSTFVLQGTFDTHGHDGTAGSGGTVAHADTGPTADDHHTKPTTPGEVGAAPASHLTDDPAHTFAELFSSAQGADRILTTDGQGDPDSVAKDTLAPARFGTDGQWEFVDSLVLGGDAAAVAFEEATAGDWSVFRAFRLRLRGRSNNSNGFARRVVVQFNDDVGDNYRYVDEKVTAPNTAFGGIVSTIPAAYIVIAHIASTYITNDAETWSTVETVITNPAARWKTVRSRYAHANTRDYKLGFGTAVGDWQSTATITRMVLSLDASSFQAPTSLILEGAR